jgi:teichuronic acid biosynthesis glycosyltransferase TuaC
MSMRIAVVTTSYPQTDEDPGGHFVRSEVDELVRQGHEVTVLCPGVRSPVDERANPRVVRLGASGLFGWPGALARIKQAPWSLWQLAPFVLRARKALNFGAYDRAVAHWLVPSGWPVMTAAPCPTEIVVHGSDARLVAALPAWIRNWLFAALCRRGHHLRFVAPHLKSLLAVRTSNAWIMSSPVQSSPLSLPPLPNKAEARRALGLDIDSYIVSIIGRLISSKRVDVALERTQLPEGTHVYVIGSGPCLPNLLRRFPRVVFLGQLPRSQTLLWLKASDVLLSASQNEGAPTVIREARALGVAVWSAPSEAVASWASLDSGIRVLPELA